MQKINFSVIGSSDEPYDVTFEFADGHLRAFCTCAAGANGQACKHRSNLLAGVVDGVTDANSEKLSLLAEWLKGSAIERAITSVTEAERQLEAAKQAVAKAKKHLGRTFMNGGDAA